MHDVPKETLSELDIFELSHVVAIKSALNELVETLYSSGAIGRDAVARIDAAYRAPLEVRLDSPLSASVRLTHDKFFAELLSKDIAPDDRPTGR